MESLLPAACSNETADATFAIRYLHLPPSLIVPPPEIVRPPFEIVWPPFTLRVDAFRVEGMLPPPGLYGAPLIVLRFILFVLMLDVMTDPAGASEPIVYVVM
jgi:hypothetical protein